MRNEGAARTPVTIVCVYNDPDVLGQCLARSVAEHLSEAPDTEFIPVDNRGNPFSSAGAALNHGAAQATNDVVVFVHQDVVLHSLRALERAAATMLADRHIGILGAIGMDADDRLVGRIRDRVVRAGRSVCEPTDVQSLDEVLLMIRRDQLAADPLSEHPLLAWHAYGVEYCARMRARGLRAAAIDIPLTHNSLTVNLKDLDLAHRHVGELYPHLLPLRTTCGTVWRGDAPRGAQRVRHYARRAQIYWSESATARALTRSFPESTVVIADVRMVIDAILSRSDLSAVRVIDLDGDDAAAIPVDGLSRFGREYSTSTVAPADASALLAGRRDDELLLFTARSPQTMTGIEGLPPGTHVFGHTHDTGVWLAVGGETQTLQPLWSTRRNLPFAGLIGSSPRVGSSTSHAVA